MRRSVTIDGDIKKAIERYERIASRFRGEPAVAARALLEMAELQERAGQTEARRTYERILAEFGSATESAAAARTRLARLQNGFGGGMSQVGLQTRVLWDNAVDFWGTATADGRYMSFPDWETGDLGVRDLIARQSRRVTNKGGYTVAKGETKRRRSPAMVRASRSPGCAGTKA